MSEEEYIKMYHVYEKGVEQSKILTDLAELTSSPDLHTTNHAVHSFELTPSGKKNVAICCYFIELC